jgi:hypothetical protein
MIRKIIREMLLLEEVYGAQAIVYHGTKADPKVLISALLNDKFVPGRGAGSMYGKGLYTVYDLTGTQTGDGSYGNHVIKLKLNLYGYIIFDPEIALKVYKAPLSIVEQAQELGLDEGLVKMLKNVVTGKNRYTSVAAEIASKFLKGAVKGLVYTGSRDGRCALVYDPTTAVPIAWKNVKDESWTQVDRESIKPSLRRSASGDWEEGKYEIDPVRMVEKLRKLPVEKRIVRGGLDLSGSAIESLPEGLKIEGHLDLTGTYITSLPAGLQVGSYINLANTSITSLPEGLKVGGTLDLMNTPIKSLPAGLEVEGMLDLSDTNITTLPAGLKIGGSLSLSNSAIESLPADLHVGGVIDLSNTKVTSLPAGLKVWGSLILWGAPITSLPEGLKVGRNLDLTHTSITSLPAGLQVGRDLNLYSTNISSLPQDLQVGGEISGFSGVKSKVPQHLKAKLAR